MTSKNTTASPTQPDDRRLGASLRFAHCPTHVHELDRLHESLACAACGQVGSFLAGDQGPQRTLGPVVYYRPAIRCACGFTNYMNVVVNDLRIEGMHDRQPSRDALRQAEEAGLLPNPDAEELLMNSAAACHRGDLQEAERLIAACLRVAPDHPGAWYNRGVLLASRGDDEGAIEAFTKAVDLSDEFVSAWLKLGEIQGRRGEFEQAAVCLDKFLERYPDHNEALRLRSLCTNAIEGDRSGERQRPMISR